MFASVFVANFFLETATQRIVKKIFSSRNRRCWFCTLLSTNSIAIFFYLVIFDTIIVKTYFLYNVTLCFTIYHFPFRIYTFIEKSGNMTKKNETYNCLEKIFNLKFLKILYCLSFFVSLNFPTSCRENHFSNGLANIYSIISYNNIDPVTACSRYFTTSQQFSNSRKSMDVETKL